ncbi:MAG: uroporphyrinogen decarboxylase [Gammaproteobacteria bacterium]
MTPPHSLLLRALMMERVARRPFWLMRQAGRYLPEYRAVREKCGGFLAMAKSPPVACEITLQPVRRFDTDAAIIFSDILTIPDAMGLGLHFIDGEGPKLQNPLRDENAVGRLRPVAEGELDYVYDACRLAVGELPADIPLIGFCGSPWTLACYMIDGGGGGFWRARKMVYDRPDLLHRILAANAEAAVSLLCGQLAAGCRVAMIFDSWGGLLGGDDYETFSLRYIRDIINAVKAQHNDAPIIVFARQCHRHLAAIAKSGCDAAGIDWQTPMSQARDITGGKIALQGNMDPAVLLADADAVRREAKRILCDFGDGHGHIFNLGHGVDKNTPPENVAVLADAVRGHKL